MQKESPERSGESEEKLDLESLNKFFLKKSHYQKSNS